MASMIQVDINKRLGLRETRVSYRRRPDECVYTYNKRSGNGFILLATRGIYVGLRVREDQTQKKHESVHRNASYNANVHAVQAFYNGHSINDRTIIFDRTLFAPEHDLLHVANSRFVDWATFLSNIFFFREEMSLRTLMDVLTFDTLNCSDGM